MCLCSLGCRLIKVLADLENGATCISIDMQVLKDLKSHPLQKNARGAGDNPANRGHLGNPAPASEQMRARVGQAPALREGQQLTGDRPPRYGRAAEIPRRNVGRGTGPRYIET